MKDITGINLTPSPHGENCLGNGISKDENGMIIECCCDECAFFLTCYPEEIVGFTDFFKELKQKGQFSD